MAEVRAYVDIEVDDFLRYCSTSEKEEIIEILKEEGYIPGEKDSSDLDYNIFEYEWQDALRNLELNRLRISKEDEEIIKKISKKY